MKMTYGQILEAWAVMALPTPNGDGGPKPGIVDRGDLDVLRVIVPLRRASRRIEEHRQDFIAARAELADRRLVEREDADSFREPPGINYEQLRQRDEAFANDLAALVATEVEIDVDPIAPEAFEGSSITIAELDRLGPLVTL